MCGQAGGGRFDRAMETVEAVELRRRLDTLLERLERNGAPVLVCRRQKPVAALVSLEAYRERFPDAGAHAQRHEAVARLRQLAFEPPPAGTALDLLRALRS